MDSRVPNERRRSDFSHIQKVQYLDLDRPARPRQSEGRYIRDLVSLSQANISVFLVKRTDIQCNQHNLADGFIFPVF